MSRMEMRAVGVTTIPPNTVSGPYTTDSYVLVWMDEGEATVVLEGETIALSPGTLVLTPPGGRVAYHWDPHFVRMGYLHFVEDGATPRKRLYRLGGDDVVPSILRHILWLALERPEHWAESGQHLLEYVLRALENGRSGTRLAPVPPLPERLERVLIFLAAEWHPGPLRAPSLAELAASANITPEYLSRSFTKELGVPPLTAIRLLRLDRAAALLRSTDLPVRVVAERCGFANEFHFSVAFRRYASAAPSIFRELRTEVPLLPASLRPLARYLHGEDVGRYLVPGWTAAGAP